MIECATCYGRFLIYTCKQECRRPATQDTQTVPTEYLLPFQISLYIVANATNGPSLLDNRISNLVQRAALQWTGEKLLIYLDQCHKPIV